MMQDLILQKDCIYCESISQICPSADILVPVVALVHNTSKATCRICTLPYFGLPCASCATVHNITQRHFIHAIIHVWKIKLHLKSSPMSHLVLTGRKKLFCKCGLSKIATTHMLQLHLIQKLMSQGWWAVLAHLIKRLYYGCKCGVVHSQFFLPFSKLNYQLYSNEI